MDNNLIADVAKSEVELGDRFTAALVYAAKLHQHQRRKVTGVPYISHLLGVAALVIEDGGCEDSAIAALLHDAVEDQGGEATLIDIRERFGEQVAEWVLACTAAPRKAGEDWRSHKQAYLKQIQSAPPQVKRIVLADKLHNGACLLANLSAVGHETWKAFSGSQQDIVWFYQSLMQSLSYLSCEHRWMTQRLQEITEILETNAAEPSALEQPNNKY